MQTPKEKAYNIFKKFYNVDGQGFNNTISSSDSKAMCKAAYKPNTRKRNTKTI